MSARYCYWSVADGIHAEMMKVAVASARKAGVTQDFHIWSDREIPGAFVHKTQAFNKRLYLFKLKFLFQNARLLDYDYFIWIDADNFFVRDPGDVLAVLQGSPVHVTLESDSCASSNTRADWWGCPLNRYAELMRECGVQSRSIFNVNAGFWIVKREVVETFCHLCYQFWRYCKQKGFEFTEEAPMAYAMHMLCGNPYRHTLSATSDLWASDWTRVYRGRLPDGRSWRFTDYFNGSSLVVNPAIVHAMRSKPVMLKQAATGIV